MNYGSGRIFALDVGFQNKDTGAYQWQVVKFNEDSSDWQYLSDRVIAPFDYSNIRIYALYYKEANTAYFDGIQFYKEEFGQSYTYDSNGNVISSEDLADQQSSFQYTNNDLTKAIDPKGSEFTYNYDSKHNLKDATSAENVVYSFTYDSYGNPVTSKVGDTTLFIESSATYTANGNYLSTLTDSEGNKVSYNYDATKGNLDSITDAKGSTTSYEYNTNTDQLEAVSKTVGDQTVANSYTYENDRLKTVTHNDDQVTYSFDYDSMGNNTEVKVGSQTLISNIYEKYNQTRNTGNLIESTYGNNQKVGYDYDSLDRVTAKKYDDTVKFKYKYDGNGNLGSTEDLVNNTTIRYFFDLSNRLTKITESNGNSISYEYDKNNISTVSEKIGESTYETNHQYDKDNRPKSISFGPINETSTSTLNYKYDPLGRLNNIMMNTGSSQYATNYYFQDGINGATTSKLNMISNNGEGISYTYDKNGNIETIRQDGKLTKYRYNELNELIVEETYNNSGLIAYYSFDNEDITDNSGNGNDGKAYGSPTFVNRGQGKAIKFDGVDDWAELTDFSVPESFSVSAWVNPYTTDNSQNFIGKHTSTSNIFLLGFWESGNHVRIRNATTTQGVSQTGYQHITATVEKVSSTQSSVTVYRNGTLLGQSTVLNDAMGNTQGKPWVLAQEWDGETLSDFFQGEMDDVAFYDHTLSQGEVSSIYTDGVVKDNDGLLAYYTFDNLYDLNSAVISDDSGNGNDGKTYGSPQFVTGINGQALEFDGVDDWAEFTDFEVPESFSVSAWINPYRTTNGQNFIGKHTSTGGNIFLMGYWSGGNHVRIRSATTTQGTSQTGYQHITATVKKLNSTQSHIKMYKDGTLIGESTINDVMGDTQGKPWVLGQEWDGGTLSDFFQGAMDEVAFYDHTLTGEEVSSIYTDGVKVSPRTVKAYSYDAGGNILKKEEYTYDGTSGLTLTDSIDYGYTDTNWKDKLTSYDGKSITYDAIGNPLTYDGWDFTWEAGRQLKEMSNTTTNTNLDFKYNGTDQIHYTYDANGSLISMNLNGDEYYYTRNAQGDVIGLYDSNGTEVVSYSYDAWGKVLSITGSLAETVGEKNPYLYRGYRYDAETGLYYLQSRYYNPDWGRFVNADGIVGTTGELLSNNMFAYAANDPINRNDPSGYLWAYIKEFASQLISTINTLRPAYAASGGAALVDGPLPVGDLIGVAIAGVATVGAIGYAGYNTITSSREDSKGISITTDATRGKNDKGTIIYRYGSGSNTNLTPRPKDIGGLSFSLTPPSSGKYVVTTIQAVNATGVLKAVKDGPNHVSIKPTVPSTMSSWIASRPSAQLSPHPYTVVLKSIVWDAK